MKPALLRPLPTARSVFGSIVVRARTTADARASRRFVFVRRGALVDGAGR